MDNFNAEIIPGKSVGNFLIGDNINNYLSIYSNYEVKSSEYILPNNEKRLAYFIDSTLEITTLSSGEIVAIGCNEKYKGKCKGIFYPGQKLVEIIASSTRQRIFNGCIVIDNDFGFVFELPAPYDEIGDSIQSLPSELKLEFIRVADFSTWNYN